MNGKPLEASFSNLIGLAVDGEGNIFVADSRNNLIRKISKDGLVTTLAGSGEVGSKDGKGTRASFFSPTALTVDKKGIVYVADTHNNLIRAINPDGTVTTLAGKTGLKFDNPSGIAVDTFGNLYVSDWNNQIRKITPDGEVTNFAGHGTRGALNGDRSKATFYLPYGLAVDLHGNLFVSDCYNNQIRKISPAGQVTTLAGMIVKGARNDRTDSSSFFHPAGIAIDQIGNIYVADTGNNLIRRIGVDHRVTTLAGTGTRGLMNGKKIDATFWRPTGIAVDSAGNIFIADCLNNVIRKISQ